MKKAGASMLALFLAAATLASPATGRRSRGGRRPARHEVPTFDPAEINNSALATPLTKGARGSAALRLQILLDRLHFSPGEIDGGYGENTQRAVAAFQASQDIPADPTVGPATWTLLNQSQSSVLAQYRIAKEDVAGPFEKIPEDVLEKAKLNHLGYSSPLEEIGEKFHASPKLLEILNPGRSFDREGEEITVPAVATNPPPPGAAISVVKSDSSVVVQDAAGKLIARYPATLGSRHDPLPIGAFKVTGVRKNPVFRYNADLFWDADEKHAKALIPAGPNNPVGVVWIDLSKPHYGIHGSPEPSTIGKSTSHGCIRLTNWDAWELSQIVATGTPITLRE
jgi:lipoprotein-anchoring transpeptidase ErfK/SrfK